MTLKLLELPSGREVPSIEPIQNFPEDRHFLRFADNGEVVVIGKQSRDLSANTGPPEQRLRLEMLATSPPIAACNAIRWTTGDRRNVGQTVVVESASGSYGLMSRRTINCRS